MSRKNEGLNYRAVKTWKLAKDLLLVDYRIQKQLQRNEKLGSVST
jgi:hypothetical protein